MFYRKQAELMKSHPTYTQRGKRRKKITKIRQPLQKKVDPHKRAPFANLLGPHKEKQGESHSSDYSKMEYRLNPKTPEFIDTDDSSSESETENSNEQAT